MESECFIAGIRPHYRKMLADVCHRPMFSTLRLDFYEESLTECDVYGIVSYLWLNGRWMVQSVVSRFEDRPRPVAMTFIRAHDWARYIMDGS